VTDAARQEIEAVVDSLLGEVRRVRSATVCGVPPCGRVMASVEDPNYRGEPVITESICRNCDRVLFGDDCPVS
jgi:hypothetical protein